MRLLLFAFLSLFAQSCVVICPKTTMTCHARQTFCSLMSVLFLCVAADLNAPVVHTKLGSLKGEYVSVKGKETGVHAYLGVPFAKPPLGPSLRLAPPQPVEGWEGVRDATKQPPMCIQPERFALALLDKLGFLLADIPDISEDCLYLNIYTPAKRANDAKLPVMVWIHGGGLSVGSASTYDGSALAAYQDMVVVLIQYRLGLLGFLSTGDEHISGNFGLLDQIEALKWIQQHIHNFGGDPGLVTIFGESAGGVSVSLLLLSPLSEGLFHRAIAESGTAAMDLLVENDPLPKAQEVANASGCSLESTKTFADCMRSLDIDIIVDFTKDRRLRCPVNVDGHFLTKPVDELFRKHELLTVPFMTGVNNDEAGWMLKNLFISVPQNWAEGMDRDQVINAMAFFYPNPKDAFIKNLITDEYIGNGADHVKNRDGFSEVAADIIFNIPVIKTANAHREAGAPVYLYEYQHSLKMVQKRRPSFVGSDHTDEIFTVLGFCFTTTHVKLPYPCLEEEEELSRTMMSYWGNFARTGSPDGHNLVHWPKYGADEKYLAIGLKKQVTAQHLKKERFVFLTQTVPEKIQQHEENPERSEL
ncbi:cocaine esterase-like isoform X1 [Oreochromis aureus]|uniref:cocaine esterase-like isoform X1 n=1 Tax=Oreochromis aureus TaxID=47969 RepID=UPI0019534449|nr:cocaine esterase-like isoform X1 [Oreochromis aureus]